MKWNIILSTEIKNDMREMRMEIKKDIRELQTEIRTSLAAMNTSRGAMDAHAQFLRDASVGKTAPPLRSWYAWWTTYWPDNGTIFINIVGLCSHFQTQ